MPIDDYVARWALDDGSGSAAADSSGNGNTGTLINAPSWVAGKIAGGVSFNGSSQYITVPDSASLSITGAITLACWVKPNANLDDGNFHIFLSKGQAGTPAGYELFYDANSDEVGMGIHGNGGYRDWRCSKLFAVNAWVHLVGVWNGSTTTAIVYANAVVVPGAKAGDAGNFQLDDGSVPLGLGAWPGGPSRYSNIIMDDVRIFNRALSEAEVIELYYWRGGGSPGDPSSPGFGNDSNTKFLLDPSGADASTVFDDICAGASPHTTDAFGAAQIDTGVQHFSRPTVLLDGSSSVVVDRSADFDTTSEDFVYDWWARLTSLPTNANIIEIGTRGNYGVFPSGLHAFSFGVWDDGEMYFYSRPDGAIILKGPDTVSLNTWTHFAIVCSGSTLRIFLNGVEQDAGGFDISSLRYLFDGDDWAIGCRADGIHGMVGNIGQVRLSVGTDRGWSGGFTPPAAAYSAGAPRSQAAIMG